MHALLDAIAATEIPTDARRIFHGRGGLHPGCEQWTLDFFPPVWLLTSFQPVTDQELGAVGEALAARWAKSDAGQALSWVFQHRREIQAETRLMAGPLPEPHVVSEEGARYLVHLMTGMNHGLFLDMSAGRRWVREHLAARPGQRVLNLFAYSCSFSVVALQAGASQVTNVDMSAGALATGKRNHQLNGLTKGASFLPHDIFNSWGKIGRAGPYDLIVLDPPSYQKGSFVAEKDYVRLMRRLPGLLAPGGHALLCLNSPKLGPSFLRDAMSVEAPGLSFVRRLPNPPEFADISDERALKVLIYKAPD